MGSTGDPLPKAFGTTRRPEDRGDLVPETSPFWIWVRSSFHPASRRAARARGLLPKDESVTASGAVEYQMSHSETFETGPVSTIPQWPRGAPAFQMWKVPIR